MKEQLSYIQKLLGLAEVAELEQAVRKLSGVSGKDPTSVLERLIEENEDRFARRCSHLGHPRARNAEPVYQALLREVGETEEELRAFFSEPSCKCDIEENIDNLLQLAFSETPYQRGFFLRPTVAAELLRTHPPRGMLAHLGYPGVATMLKEENIFEIFGALRFSEDAQWMDEMIQLYRGLTPDDFEERIITVLTLDRKKWYPLAKEYIEKKYHNLSHSKEMGVVFLIPTPGQFFGLNLRALALLFHYFSEVHFYSSLFVRAAQSPATFGEHLGVAITGDVPEAERAKSRPDSCWYILQRYLAKDPTQDLRFVRPHVMPEAIHWKRAFVQLEAFARKHDLKRLEVWNGGSEWIAKRFAFDGDSLIVTLNVEDVIFSYAKQLAVENAYTYHWRESFWNRIFSAFVGEDEMIQLIEKDLHQGIIDHIN